jgi:hypothetical protein
LFPVAQVRIVLDVIFGDDFGGFDGFVLVEKAFVEREHDPKVDLLPGDVPRRRRLRWPTGACDSRRRQRGCPDKSGGHENGANTGAGLTMSTPLPRSLLQRRDQRLVAGPSSSDQQHLRHRPDQRSRGQGVELDRATEHQRALTGATGAQSIVPSPT